MLTPQVLVEISADHKKISEARVVPHSIEVEEALIGAFLLDAAIFIECGYLEPGDFYLTRNGQFYQTLKGLFEAHKGYDIVTVTEALEARGILADIGGAGAIMDYINATPTSMGGPEYAAIVYRYSVQRQLINAATKATQLAYQSNGGKPDEMVNQAIDLFSEIDATKNISGGPQAISSGVSKFLDRLEEIEALGDIVGLKTGIKTLDYTLGGLNKKKTYLLAGRPGMGKSALALQIALNVSKQGKRVAIFSLEMSEEDIAARLTSSICKVPYESYNRPQNGTLGKVIQAADTVSRLPIVIDDTPALTITSIRSRLQKLMISEDVDLVIIDHGGIVKPEKYTGNTYADQSHISDQSMQLAKQLDMPVLELLQLSRSVESRNEKRPVMSDLRDTGKWEENADCIMFLYRDEVYNPDTEFPRVGEINTVKNRGGKSGHEGKAMVYVDVATNTICDLDRY